MFRPIYHLCVPLALMLVCDGIALAQSEEKPASSTVSLLPAKARPEVSVTERDLAMLVRRVARRTGAKSSRLYVAIQPNRPVNRMGALMALVKAGLPPSTLNQYREEMPDQMPPDIAQIATAQRPFIAAAIGEGWLTVDRPVRARQIATWSYVGKLVAQIHPVASQEQNEEESAPEERPHPQPREEEAEPDTKADVYSGLIVDVSGLKIERASSPRLLDEEGRIVYPDPKHLPSDDFVDDKGMVAYCSSLTDTNRAGKNPLVVKGVRTSESRYDIILSNEEAAKVRKANRAGHFLWKWAVCMVSEKPKPVTTTASKTTPEPKEEKSETPAVEPETP